MNQAKESSLSRNASLSFEAITSELGEIEFPSKLDLPSSEEENALSDFGGTIIVDDEHLPPVLPANNPNLRVLTGCSPTPRPLWIDGILSASLAAFFILPIVFRLGLRQYQPWVSYMAILLAFGAGVWSLYGLRMEPTKRGRQLCCLSAAINFAVVLIAFLVRAPSLK